MSKFNLEISSENNICIELYCNKCENKFSSELDTNFKDQKLPFQNQDTLYCLYCEKPYEYTIKFNNNNLELIFKDNELFGRLRFSEKTYLEEFKSITPGYSKKYYLLQIETLEKIIKLKSDEPIVDQALYRLVYGGVITSLETYLSEIFTQIVFRSEYNLEIFVSEYEPYKKEKISLHEIFRKHNGLEMRVRDDLSNFIYHNISKLINVFNIFNFELDKFKKIRAIATHIQKRHNLVHKSGMDKNDNLQEVLEKDIILMIEDINSFVEYIDIKIKENSYKELDLPF